MGGKEQNRKTRNQTKGAVTEDGKILRLIVDAMVSKWNQRDHVGVEEADKGDCQCPSKCNSILRSHIYIHTLVRINSV